MGPELRGWWLALLPTDLSPWPWLTTLHWIIQPFFLEKQEEERWKQELLNGLLQPTAHTATHMRLIEWRAWQSQRGRLGKREA